MVRIAVAGAMGRMGNRIVALSREYEPIKLTGVFEKKGQKDIGKDIGLLTGIGETCILLQDSIEKAIGQADVVVDFTHASSTLEHLRAASSAGKAHDCRDSTNFVRERLRSIAC